MLHLSFILNVMSAASNLGSAGALAVTQNKWKNCAQSKKYFLKFLNVEKSFNQIDYMFIVHEKPDIFCHKVCLILTVKKNWHLWKNSFNCNIVSWRQSAVHQNGQNTDEFGQISKIFETSNYFQLHNLKSKWFHQSLKTLNC